METQGLSMDDAIFCGCAGAFVLVNLIVYCHEAPVLCRTCYGKVKSLRWRRWRDWYPTISRNDQIREAFLYRETCARKVVWARRCMSYALPLPACGLVPVLYNIWAGNERWMSVGFSWSLLLTYVSLLTVHLMPSLVTASVLDFICLVAHGLMAFWLSPLGSPNFDDVFILQLVCFMMVQTVAVSIAAHYTGVLLSQGLVVGVVVWRMFAETDFAAGPDTVANPRTLVLCNIFCTGAVVAIHNVANRLIRHTVETAMRASDSNRHLSAASALLELTCEAVCELDSDLKLQLHSQKLATMLLRRSGVSLEGRKLTDFISPGEAERAQEILMSQSDCAAHAFHTHLVDSYSSKFRTEVFQVKYAMMDGRECHLVGLRDFTDLKSLAGENATDAIQDESELAADAAASAESHGREVHVLDVPERSCELPPGLDYWDNSSESDRSNATLERNECENGIVEKRLKYAHKDAFLEIDMDAEMVEAASAPFCSLAGKSVSQSFASDFTRELLHRLREDAIQFNAQRKSQDFQVPDQVATFKATPIYVDRSITMASGVMKVSLTRYGGLKVIMCINHSEVQNTMTNALHSFTSKSPEGTGMSPLSL